MHLVLKLVCGDPLGAGLTDATFPFFPPLGPRDDSSGIYYIQPDWGSEPGYLNYAYLAVQHLVAT
jgi:hypothetical protein